MFQEVEEKFQIINFTQVLLNVCLRFGGFQTCQDREFA